MNLILHIVAKDFLFLRGRLAAWLGVIAVKIALGFWLVLGASLSDRGLVNLAGAFAGLIVVDVALTLLLAALLVQEDGLVGTSPFWRTRPISGVRLLAAKLLAAFLLLIAPAVLVTIPWWWLCGLSPGQLAMAATEILLVQWGLLLIAFTAGSVTNSIGRCFVWGAVGVAATQGIMGAWSLVPGLVGRNSGPAQALAVYVGALVPVAVATILWQYLARRPRVGLMILVAGLIVSPPIAILVTRTLGAKPAESVVPWGRDRPELTRDIAVTWRKATSGRAPGVRPLGRIELEYEVTGVPPGHGVLGIQAKHVVRTGNGEAANIKQHTISGENIGLLAGRRLQEITDTAPGRAAGRTVAVRSAMVLEAEALQRLKGEPLDVTANLTWEMTRLETLTSLPAAPGKWQAAQGFGVRIMRQEGRESDPQVVIVESEPLAFLTTKLPLLSGRHPWRESVFYVLQPEAGGNPSTRSGRRMAGLAIGGVQLYQRTLAVSVRQSATEATVNRHDWTPAATMTVVKVEHWAVFEREVKVPRMELQERR